MKKGKKIEVPVQTFRATSVRISVKSWILLNHQCFHGYPRLLTYPGQIIGAGVDILAQFIIASIDIRAISHKNS